MSDNANSRIINVVTDNDGWQLKHSADLVDRLAALGHRATLVTDYGKVTAGDMAFYLGCLRLTPPDVLARNAHNLVVHASDLPEGRGFSPLTWMILEGKNDIPVCLIEAADGPDSGPIYYKEWISFEGHELIDQLRDRLAAKSMELCLRFACASPLPTPRPQVGTPTAYPRRRPADSAIDPTEPISAVFNQLRVADNDAYPAFFQLHGHTYVLKISKADE